MSSTEKVTREQKHVEYDLNVRFKLRIGPIDVEHTVVVDDDPSYSFDEYDFTDSSFQQYELIINKLLEDIRSSTNNEYVQTVELIDDDELSKEHYFYFV